MKVGVIGAGASGLMACSFIDESHEVYLIDQNEKLGKKIYITGKGRCNITNDSDVENLLENINTNKNFCYSPFYSFTSQDMISFLEKNGLKTKTERGNRVFPLSDKSSDVIKLFEKVLKKRGVKIRLKEKVLDIVKNDSYHVLTDKATYDFDKLIIACGGRSYKATGSDGSLYPIIEKLGHNMVAMKAGLVPVILKEDVSRFEGISLRNIGLSCSCDGKLIYKEQGELVFTHDGLSGPLVLTLSSKLAKREGNIEISIDLKPGLYFEKLDERILRDFDANKNKSVENSLSKITISALIRPILKNSGVDPDKKTNLITKEERARIVESIKKMKFTYLANKDINYAIISIGGVNVDEINPSTMESKLNKNLYFCGEVIDVDAYTGGYNLQFAFSTGYLAGVNI
ncbi:MAG: aminoacetone oxidase family FAD-binding enzyme [Finegoldia sp.]|nr:aminoacetone oxidase family FAD-binding enzyme [Finegoldia sp.]